MTPFYKVSGAGNDFIALVEQPLPTPDQVRAWCRRGLSAGADGLFVLAPAGTGAARMTYFNADGGEAALCINGTRCAARLAFEQDWGAADGTVTIETGIGPLAARRIGPTEIALEVPTPSPPVAERQVVVDGREIAAHFVTVGVPHLVVDCPDGVADAPVASLGALLRHHPDFAPEGTNVNFVAWTARDRLEVRSFERGVEAETFACGTGVLAAVAAGLATGRADLPARAATLGGFVLTVQGSVADGRPIAWSLAGDARIVAAGRLAPEAELLPGSQKWR